MVDYNPHVNRIEHFQKNLNNQFFSLLTSFAALIFLFFLGGDGKVTQPIFQKNKHMGIPGKKIFFPIWGVTKNI